MAFPTNLTNATDGSGGTEIVAAQLNNVEAAIGIDGSTAAGSIQYRLGDVGSGQKGWLVGDLKVSFNTDGYGWLVCDGGTVGDLSSTADNKSASYSAIFAFLVTLGYTPTDTWANHGKITLPDFRDRTIIGASGTKALASTGGAATINLLHSHTCTAHNHTVTINSSNTDHSHTGPNHQHWVAQTANTSAESSDTSDMNAGDENRSRVSTGHVHSFSVGVSSDAAGTGSTGTMSANTTHGHTNSVGNGSATSMDNQLSATQSILNPYLATNVLIKY